MKRAIILAGFGLFVALGGGCTYYAVTDMGSGKMYYTQRVNRRPGSPVVSFKDAETGDRVRLTNAVVAKIGESEYTRGVSSSAR